MAINAGLPVLLQGPVGCGKTSLVEYLSHMTGRTTSPYLIKVQLGDQMDSKVSALHHARKARFLNKCSVLFYVD
jgi:MoxR-like ATPase